MSTRIIRTRDAKSVEYMIPHFTFSVGGDEAKETFGRRLMQLMQNTPELVNVIQAWQGENITGFVVSTALEDSFIWIAQAWSKTGNSERVADEMFLRTILWTIALGRLALRAETSRDLDAMYRRFKFKPVASIIEHRISPEVVASILDRGKEIING